MRTSHIRRKLTCRRARKAYEEAVLTPQMRRADGPKTGAEAVAQLEADGVIGAWAGRQDIGDSAEYARGLRRQTETRQRG